MIFQVNIQVFIVEYLRVNLKGLNLYITEINPFKLFLFYIFTANYKPAFPGALHLNFVSHIQYILICEHPVSSTCIGFYCYGTVKTSFGIYNSSFIYRKLFLAYLNIQSIKHHKIYIIQSIGQYHQGQDLQLR